MERLRAYVQHRQWRLHPAALWDTCGPINPQDRPGWSRALGLVLSGFAQGIVTLDPQAVSSDVGQYVAALEDFRAFQGFLAHVPHAWSPATGRTAAQL